MSMALHSRFWLEHLLHYKLHWLVNPPELQELPQCPWEGPRTDRRAQPLSHTSYCPTAPLTGEEPLHLLGGARPRQSSDLHHVSLAALRVEHHIGGEALLCLCFCGCWKEQKGPFEVLVSTAATRTPSERPAAPLAGVPALPGPPLPRALPPHTHGASPAPGPRPALSPHAHMVGLRAGSRAPSLIRCPESA